MNVKSIVARRLWALCSLAVASALLVPPAGAADTATEGSCGIADAAGTVTLCETTTVVGDEPASMAVNLTRAATVQTPFGSSPDLSVTGDGRFVGIVLTGTAAATRGTTLVGGQFPSPDEGVEFLMPVPEYPLPGGGHFEIVKTYANEVTLPAGPYRLYLLTDGADAEVTLHLDGLEGAGELAPQTPADYDLAFPPPRLTSGGGMTNNVYAAGRSGELAATGLLFQALWLETDAHAAAQHLFCYAPDSGFDVDPVDLGPGCPLLAEKVEFVNNRTATLEPDTKMYLLGLDQMSAGIHHFGFWYAAQAVVTDVQYAQFWLTYEDTAGSN